MPSLTASDGHRLQAYEKRPSGKPRGGLVVLQEIFGVNDHIRSVADGFPATPLGTSRLRRWRFGAISRSLHPTSASAAFAEPAAAR